MAPGCFRMSRKQSSWPSPLAGGVKRSTTKKGTSRGDSLLRDRLPSGLPRPLAFRTLAAFRSSCVEHNHRGVRAASSREVFRRPLQQARRYPPDLFVLLRRDDLLAAIEAVRADVMTAMRFAGRRFDSRRRILQEVMSTAIAATGDRFLILLNSHG